MIMNMMWRREKRAVSFQRTENRTTARRLKASRAHDDAVELVMIMEETEKWKIWRSRCWKRPSPATRASLVPVMGLPL